MCICYFFTKKNKYKRIVRKAHVFVKSNYVETPFKVMNLIIEAQSNFNNNDIYKIFNNEKISFDMFCLVLEDIRKKKKFTTEEQNVITYILFLLEK